MKKAFLSILLIVVFATFSNGQTKVNGRVSDEISGDPISGVNISVLHTNLGTSTQTNGNFSLELSDGNFVVEFSSVGYVSSQKQVQVMSGQDIDLGNIKLKPFIIGLQEVSIISSVGRDRYTPVAMSTIPSAKIETQLGDQPLPDIMKMVPGVYSARTGGGSGDASVSIRGFQQENVALLLNGIPIGSVENGLVYWNNWLGLSDATQQIQVQRGLGASRVALNSVGGTINILTHTTEAPKGGVVRYAITDYGNSRFSLSYNTGKLKNGMAVSFLGSRISGPGYVDATYVDAWGYFLSVSKEFNHKHKLVFVGLGNPERHGQRNIMLTQAETDQYGLKFNKDWGSYNGKINNASENFYHKPHLSLNHYWNINERSMLATSIYFSSGKGGGKWSDKFMTNLGIGGYRNPSNQIDWESIYVNNNTHTDYYVLANGDTVRGFSKNIQTNFLASHVWTGIISTLEHKLGDNFQIMAGIHYRYFKSSLQQKVRDLLGGDFFIDNYAYAVDGIAGRQEIKGVGDVIKIDNGAIINFANLFGQVEYHRNRLHAFLAGSISSNWYQRYDHYNYVSNPESKVVELWGFDVKAGLNYNLNEYHNVYFNTGYFSRVPYYKYIFGNYTNEPTLETKNEKITSAELGYGFSRNLTGIKANIYYTYWKDRSFLANEYNQFLDPVMINGLDAEHFGVEIELSQGFGKYISLGGLLSLGNWQWKNNVSAEVYDNNNVLQDTVQIYADGLYVGDAPQVQTGITGKVQFLKMFALTANYIYYDKLYAGFNPVSRNNPADTEQPYRIPSYALLDLFLDVNFKIGSLPAGITVSCFNALNHKHIIRGLDGTSHNLDTFSGFWGFGRNFSFSFSLRF
ncbi:MAG: TonB-dependent receptor [Bacteroidetes bacterium]|nr:TonB-dependent receptor [Bacteroidota bacterium]